MGFIAQNISFLFSLLQQMQYRTDLWYPTVNVSPSKLNAIWQKPMWINTVGGQAYMSFNHILLCT